MRRLRPFASSVLVAAAAFVAVGAPGAHADDPKPPARERSSDADAAAWLGEVRSRMSRLTEAEAREAVGRLVEIWRDEGVTPATKKAVPELLGRLARDENRVAVQVAAIDGLAELSPEVGAKEIREVLTRALKAKEPSVDVYGACLRGLRRLADPSKATTSLLLDLLRRKENDVIAKAADALSGYKEAPGKLRRELLEEVLRTAEGAWHAATDTKDTTAAQKWDTIRIGVMGALRALSGQHFADPGEARAWFDRHKSDAKAWE